MRLITRSGCLVLLVSSVVAAMPLRAQVVAMGDRGPRFLRNAPGGPVPLDVGRIPELRRHVALELRNVPLGEALNTIARVSGLRLGYSRSVVPVDRNVRLIASDITVAGALSTVLFDTGIDVLFSGNQAALVLRPSVAGRGTGSIVGRVVDSATGGAILGAEVLLEKTRWRTTTDINGRYRLTDVESGSYELTVRRFGYAKETRPVTVRDNIADTVQVTLRPVAARLDEVVTTATGRQRKLELGSDLTVLNADSIVRTQPVASLTDLLETRVPGLSVQRTSGAPGDPARLRLRGTGSPLRNNDPIVIVDGIRIYAQQSAGRSRNLATRPVDSMKTSVDATAPVYAAPSPLDYIDPNSIETIEVLKGASAATLYGQDAANGVIVITTKKGRAGPSRWTMSVEHGMSSVSGKYPELLIRWGHPLDNSQPVLCPISNLSREGPCAQDSLIPFQILNDPALTVLSDAHRSAGTIGVSGGNAGLTYAVTGSYRNETGLPELSRYEADRYRSLTSTTPPDWMRRPQHLIQWGATSSLGARLGTKADITLTTQLDRMEQQRSSLEQQLGELMGTYLDRASGIYYVSNSASGVTTADNSLIRFFEQATAKSTKFSNGLNLTWRPQPWFNVSATGGLDVVQRADRIFIPRGIWNGRGTADSLGSVDYGHGTSVTSTVNLIGNATAPLKHGFQFRFAMGANYTGTSIADQSTQTSRLPIGTSLRGDTVTGFYPHEENDATFGWFVEPGINNSRLFLTMGLRLDGGSAYGSKVSLPTFPKLGISYLVSDEPFYPLKNLVPTFRVRMAYGRASRQPGPADRLRLYGTTQTVFVDSSFVSSVAIRTLGNTELRPERATELEGGFDADMLDNRLRLTFTTFRSTTDDALMATPVPPSVYGTNVNVLRNIGVVRRTGIEASVGTDLVRSGQVTWGVDVAVSRRREEMVRLGTGVEPFYTSVQNTSDGVVVSGIRIAPGYPLNGRWSRPIVGYADANDDGIIDAGEILLGDTAVYVGATLPNYEADIHANLSLWHGAVGVSATFEYQDGLSQSNDVAKNLSVFSRGVNDPTATFAEQVSSSTITDYNWIQTVNTFRFNSLAVNYTVPRAWAHLVGASTLSVAVQGVNLGLRTNYRGLDPNVNAFATGNNVTDTGVLPQPRTWQVRVNATY